MNTQVYSRFVYHRKKKPDYFAAPSTWVALQWEGSYSNNTERIQWGCNKMRPPLSPKGPCLSADHWAWRTGLKVCVHVGPLKDVRRPDGTDFLRWRISEMKSSANPAPCAPGSQGPPAYCDSLHSASFSRTLQLILGQQISFSLLPITFIDCICCFNPYRRWCRQPLQTLAKLRTRNCAQNIGFFLTLIVTNCHAS